MEKISKILEMINSGDFNFEKFKELVNLLKESPELQNYLPEELKSILEKEDLFGLSEDKLSKIFEVWKTVKGEGGEGAQSAVGGILKNILNK